MRPTRLASLMLLGLLTLGGCCASAGDRPPRKPRAAAPADAFKEPVMSQDVTGYGETDEDAYENALKAAQERLKAFLGAQDPTLDWKPPLSYVRNLATPKGRGEAKIEDLGPLREVRLHIEVSPRELWNMQAQAVEYRSGQRMLWLGKVLAGLVAFFAAVAGYFRLEEATKGYYTAWLRFGVIGFVVVVGLALLLIA